MVGIAQLVEHSVVVRKVAGSSPVAHPNIFKRKVQCPISVRDRAFVR